MPRINRRTVCRKAYRLACHIAEDLDSYSQLINPEKEAAVTRFDRDEIVLGDMLGRGGFNNVFELNEIDLLDDEEFAPSTEEQRKERRVMANYANEKTKQYAIKFLKYDLIEDNREDYCNGAADLIIETKILASLKPHPNIIRLYGMTDMSGLADDVEGSYFLILDRLNDTLENRIKTWKMNKSNSSNSLRTRLKVAFDLSAALKHLHKYNVIFRDLKPDNVGFDTEGNVKLFDFGLAKELNPDQLVEDEKYDMSGQTGSGRYMAPEVVKSEPYNLKADVFSYSILLWEICSMEEPFNGMSIGDHLNFVVNGNHRPTMKHNEWPDKICKIMKWSWMRDPAVRPSMKQVWKALKRHIYPEQEQQQSKKLFEIISEKMESSTVSTATTAATHTASRCEKNMTSSVPQQFFKQQSDKSSPESCGNNMFKFPRAVDLKIKNMPSTTVFNSFGKSTNAQKFGNPFRSHQQASFNNGEKGLTNLSNTLAEASALAIKSIDS